ncbi:MAG: hypothetical protein AAFX05_11060 [Planctomycetota bacterium]
MTATPQHVRPEIQGLFERARDLVRASTLFDSCDITDDGRLVAHASEAPEEVLYRIELDGDALYVAWVSANRYISQSIEAELMWTGDDLDDLIDEELADTGWNAGALASLEHFRNDEQLFTFRSRLPFGPADSDPEHAAKQLLCCLEAYEAAFRELGDMKAEEDDD